MNWNKWYKCRECGHEFRECDLGTIEEKHFLDGHYAGSEHFACCPECQGDYDDADYCCECGEIFGEDELYSGWCEKCLRETINYDTFFEYCEANKDEQYLDIFVMSELLGGMDCPKNVSYGFHKLMIEEYKRTVKFINDYEKAFGKPSLHNFLDACIRFIMDDDGEIGRENYADWLNKREVK